MGDAVEPGPEGAYRTASLGGGEGVRVAGRVTRTTKKRSEAGTGGAPRWENGLRSWRVVGGKKR